MHQTIEKIKQLLSEKSLLISPNDVNLPPHDYASLHLLALNQELEDECNALSDLVHNSDSEGAFRAAFKTHCQKRAVANADTCFNLMAMRLGECNGLYWQIMEILFEPKTLGEALSILLPNVTTLVSCQVDVPPAFNETSLAQRAAFMKAEIRLTEGVSAELLQQPPSLEALSHCIVSKNTIFNLNDIKNFSLDLHEKFYRAIQKDYPALTDKLYQHNLALKELFNHVMTLANKGQTPWEVIHRFIQDLRLGGEAITGQFYASVQAQLAYPAFVEYLTSLPSAMRDDLLQLKSSRGISLNDVWNHLKNENCVETAASNLQGILDNPQNKTTLTTRPNLSTEEVDNIRKQYRTGRKQTPSQQQCLLMISGNDPTISLPERYIKDNFGKIQVNDAHDYLSFLLSFPPALYNDFFAYVKINCRPALPQALGQMLSSSLFSDEQRRAINQAIANNIEKLGGFQAVIPFAKRNNNTQLLQLLLPKLLNAIKEKNNDGNTLLHRAAANPESLRIFLECLPEPERLNAVKEKDENGITVLHWAAKNLGSLPAILRLLPESDRLSAITEKDKDGDTVLGLAIGFPGFLPTILQLLPEADRLSAIKARNKDGNTILYRATNNLASLLTILQLLSKPDRLSAVKEAGHYGIIVLSWAAATNLKSVEAILQFRAILHLLLPVSELCNAVKDKNKDDDTSQLQYWLANNQASLQAILQLLPEADCLRAAKEGDDYGIIVLNQAAAVSNPASLQALLELLPESERLRVVTERDKYGTTVLHIWAANNSGSCLQAILKLLPGADRLKAVNVKDNSGITVLLQAATHPACLQALLKLLTESQRLWLVKELNSSILILQELVSENNSITVLLHQVTPHPCLRAHSGLLPLSDLILQELVAKKPAALKAILPLLGEPHRLNAFKARSNSGSTTLHLVANNPAYLQDILQSLPEACRLGAVKEKDKQGNTVVCLAATNPESLQTILQLLPESDRLDAVTEGENCHTALVRAATNSACLQTIWQLLPAANHRNAIFHLLNNKVNFNLRNLKKLYVNIMELEQYGQSLSAKNKTESELIIELAASLTKLTNAFCIQASTQECSLVMLEKFKQDFRNLSLKKSTLLQKHSAKWKPIVANILLASTGEVVAMAAKVVVATGDACISYYRNGEKPAARNFFFWGKTRSTKKVEEMNEVLKNVWFRQNSHG